MGSLKEKMDKAIKEKFWGALSEPHGLSARQAKEMKDDIKTKARILADNDNSMFIVTKLTFDIDGTEICSFDLEPFILDEIRAYYLREIEYLSEKIDKEG